VFSQPFRDRSVAPSGVGNDYQMICTAGCKLYAAYASAEFGHWDIFVRVIDPSSCVRPPCAVCAIADVDGSGLVDVNDAAAYVVARVSGSPLADVNHDHGIDTADDVLFLDALNAALTPH
jgi:hypothetical protein